ncbi:MAG: efflux RND transporter periplasmic adaptor subunit [Planctomycetota bacterium]
MKIPRLVLQIALPVLVLAGGVLLSYRIANSSKQPIVEAAKNSGPLVRTTIAQLSSVQLDVLARGTVEPLRTVELTAEVSGRVKAAHPSLRAGGSFTPNDVLIQLDDTDYVLQVTQQESAVARAELRLMQERAEGEAAERAWRKMHGDEPADALVRREPQIKDARLAVAAANAMLEKAKTDRLRCKVQLPFAGRVQSVQADIGQVVQRGQRLAVVYDTSSLEVRLPIPLDDIAFVDLPFDGVVDDGPTVKLTANFAGQSRSWTGSIVRVEGEVDRRTRQITSVARLDGATLSAGDGQANGGPPLLVGMFVSARIDGRKLDNIVAVPLSALHSGNHVWLVATSTAAESASEQAGERIGRLVDREVQVLRIERERALISSGLSAGEEICLSTIEAPVNGMLVRTQPKTAKAANGEETK